MDCEAEGANLPDLENVFVETVYYCLCLVLLYQVDVDVFCCLCIGMA